MTIRDADRTFVGKMAADFRTWPKIVRRSTAVVAVILAALPVVFAYLDGRTPETGGGVGLSMEQLEDQEPVSLAPDEAGDVTEVEFPEHTGEPAWSYAYAGEDRPLKLTPTDAGNLVFASGTLSLVEDGERVWEHSWETEVNGFLPVGETVLVISENPDGWEWPARLTIAAFGLSTGEERWSDSEVSYAELMTDIVATSSCTGSSDDDGTCVFTSRDPVDGSILWSADDVAGAQLHNSGDGVAVQLTVPEGFENGVEYTVRDAETGAIIGLDHLHSDTKDSGTTIADGMILVWLDYDGNPADGCTASLEAYPLESAERVWALASAMRESDDLKFCGEQPMTTPAGGMLAVTAGDRPAMIDFRTGATEWTGSQAAQGIGTDGRTMVTLEWEGSRDNLAGYDTDTGEELWRTSAPVNKDAKTYTDGSTMWIYSDSGAFGRAFSGAFAVNLHTGELVRMPGDMYSSGPGYVLTDTETDDGGTIQAWPTDLWADGA